MSQAFKCDICGNCVAQQADAASAREVARENTTIFGKSVDLFIVLGADVAHTCDTCFAEIKSKAKAWLNAHA